MAQPPTFKQLDERRQQLQRRLSRAELARRAGISESTITKGIKEGRVPSKPVRAQIELILEAERVFQEEGL